MPIVVRPIEGPAELDSVYRLTYDVYRRMGYCEENESGRLKHYEWLDNIPQTTCFIVLHRESIVGTITYTDDGPAGLHTDVDFRRETDAVRASGRSLCAAWRIVTTLSARHHDGVIKSLIGVAVQAMGFHVRETAMLTFNPSDIPNYMRIMHMSLAGFRDHSKHLTNAPAVLARLDWEDIPDKWLP